MIENDGKDQTFDMIGMFGAGAYCSGLWLAALCAVQAWADKMGDRKTAETAGAILEKARLSFMDKLWNGAQFTIDEQPGRSAIVFIDQCFGLWYADLLGLDHGIEQNYIKKALTHVFEKNFIADKGVVNISGFNRKERSIDRDGGQSAEILIGINLCFAAQLAFYNLNDRSTQVLEAIHSSLYRQHGLIFRTPAAVAVDQTYFRAVRNMRPLSVWALLFERRTSA